MSDSSQTRFSVTADDLRHYDWQDRLAAHPRKECYSYYEIFSGAAKQYEAAKDDLGRRVYSLLLTVASFHPNYDAKGNPYGSMWSGFNGKRSLNAEDLTEADLAALSGIVGEIEDPEFRARVADVLWVTKKDFKAGQIAITAFLESAERLKTDDLWPPYTERLERAAGISAIRGFEKESAVVLAALEGAIKKFESNEKSGLLCHRLVSIVLSLNKEDKVCYAALAERLAQHFASTGNLHFSEDYWQLAEQCYRRAKNDVDVQRCQLAAAECNISRAEAGLIGTGTKYMYAAHWMGRGLEALRRAKADPVRIAAIHRRFLELEKLSLTEMKTFEVPVDEMPGFREDEKRIQEAASAHVKGFDFQTAVERFANITHPTKLDDLKEQYAKASESNIFDKIVGVSAIDRAGKVVDTLSPSGFNTPKIEAEILRKKLAQQARDINWPLQVTLKIEPARIALINEHGMRRHDLRFLVLNNPIIPQGHEGIYLRGIQAGFFGDWLTALHLLIPQIEASIRHVLNQHNVITSTFDSEGTQQERDLNQLLWLPETEQIFGSDILFDLRGILIERFGHNLRNESAHGLLPEAGFYQPASVYIWWLIVYLCWKGFRMAQKPPEP